MALVSIVMAAYNAESTIVETVENLLAQTWADKEIIITNDGSTDNTPQILDNFAKQNPTVVKVIHQKNMGQSIARNASIAAAKGDFIAFMDADDIWAKQKIARQVQYFADHPDVGLVYTEGMTIDGRGNKLEAFGCSSEFTGNCFKTLFLRNNIIGSSVMVRKRILDKVGAFTPYLRACENWELWTRISREHKIDFIDEELAYYRQHDSNMSKNIDWMIDNRIKAVRHNHDQYKNIVPDEELLTKQAYFMAYRGFGSVYLGNLDLKKARKYIALALKYNPKSVRTYFWYLQACSGKFILKTIRKLKKLLSSG